MQTCVSGMLEWADDLDVVVAITAIHPELGDMEVMRERHRLTG